MTCPGPVHPVDALSSQQKCKIYYSRVVDLAAASGLLVPDPDTEIGHFAFSRHYNEGCELDRMLQHALRDFAKHHPDLVSARTYRLDEEFSGVATAFQSSTGPERLRDLILIGASHGVWPIGTSFTLTYPWDLEGRPRPVTFRDDLTEFMRRRILEILRKAGKLRNPQLFGPGR